MSAKKMELLRKILLGMIVIIILVLIEFVKPLRAEEPKPLFHVGGYVGFNLNSHSASFTRVGEQYFNCCPLFKKGSGTGLAAGALFEMPLNEKFFLGGRLGYSQLSGKFSPKETIGNTEVRDPNPPYETISITKATVEHVLKSNLNMAAFEPYLGFHAYEGLHVVVGLRLGYMLSPQFTQYERLINPENVTFTDGRRIRNDYNDQDIPEANSLQLHGMLGLGYDLPIGKNMYLTPEVRYFMPFMDVSNVDWKVAQFQFAAALKIPIYPPAPVALRDTMLRRDTSTVVEKGSSAAYVRLKNTEREQIKVPSDAGEIERTIITEYYENVLPKKEYLALDFDVYGVTRQGERQRDPLVIIEEIETEEGFPLLPYIFFPKGNSSLSDTRMKQFDSQNYAAFSEGRLPWNTLDIYKQLLNIIGKRMTDDPASELTLTGTNNNTDAENNNINLSQIRANNVKTYLTGVWNINPRRIYTEAVNLPAKPTNPIIPEGIEENSRVEFSSKSKDLLLPVYLKEVLRESNPPLIEIEPKVQSEAGLNRFEMTISQGGSELRNFEQTQAPVSYKWNIEEAPVPLLETPAVIAMKVTDNSNQEKQLEKQISIQQKTIKTKRTQIEGDYRVERYSLILFDFDKATILDNHRQVLEYIKSKIQPNSLVTITGYADRTGTLEYNTDLARRRSEEVTTYFNMPNIKFNINPVGSNVLIFDNDLPEGRSYSRTVRIEIRTPVGGK